MIKNSILITLWIFSSFLVISCKPAKPLIHDPIESEFLSFKKMDDRHFEYLYYNLSDSAFVHPYCTGTFTKSGNTFDLYPDNFDNLNVDARSFQRFADTLSGKLEVNVGTDLGIDYQSEFKITVFNSSKEFILNGNGGRITFIKPNGFNNFQVRIDLANHYVNNRPNPSFTYIITKEITVQSPQNAIYVTIPVKLLTFYYKFQKHIQLRDNGKYWLTQNRSILKGTL